MARATTMTNIQTKISFCVSHILRRVDYICYYIYVTSRYSNVTSGPRRLKSPTTRLFVPQLVQVNNKENTESFHHWHFMWGIYGWQVHSLTKRATNTKRISMSSCMDQRAVICGLHHRSVPILNHISRPHLAHCNNAAETSHIITSRPGQNGRHFADDIFKCIFLNENVWIPTKISLKFVSKGPINNIPALVQIMAWRRPGDKPLSGPMMVRLPTHICVTRPQRVISLSIQWIFF